MKRNIAVLAALGALATGAAMAAPPDKWENIGKITRSDTGGFNFTIFDPGQTNAQTSIDPLAIGKNVNQISGLIEKFPASVSYLFASYVPTSETLQYEVQRFNKLPDGTFSIERVGPIFSKTGTNDVQTAIRHAVKTHGADSGYLAISRGRIATDTHSGKIKKMAGYAMGDWGTVTPTPGVDAPVDQWEGGSTVYGEQAIYSWGQTKKMWVILSFMGHFSP